MAIAPQLQKESIGLGELIEEHFAEIEAKIRRDDSLKNIAEEAAKLNDLLASYRRHDELMEQLLDISTPATQRQWIRSMLEAQRLRITTNRAELVRIHARSHEVLLRSAELVLEIQRRIDKESHKHSGYALELCGFCDGIGGTANKPCPACHGKRTVLVLQPSSKCPRCGGDGYAEEWDRYISPLCIVCNGLGWVLTQPTG
jgi:hypothetical protein